MADIIWNANPVAMYLWHTGFIHDFNKTHWLEKPLCFQRHQLNKSVDGYLV